jgi:hypothetical protein
MGGLIPQKKLNAKWQGDKKAEKGSKIEKQDRRDQDGTSRFQSLRPKDWGKGFPEVVKDHRNSSEQAGVEGQFK